MCGGRPVRRDAAGEFALTSLRACDAFEGSASGGAEAAVSVPFLLPEPWEDVNAAWVDEFRQERGVAGAGWVRMARVDQDYLGAPRGDGWQRRQNEADLIHNAEPVWGDDQRVGPKGCDEVARIEFLAQRAE